MRSNELSVQQRKVLTLMQKVNYGRINNLAVVDGELVLSPEATIERDVKFDMSAEHSKTEREDFVLKKKVSDFFEETAKIGDGFIRKIEIRGGLPILIQIEEKIA